ncbi:OCIA domain-containing protein 1 [Episyrphus balteatus]|uniref:OCIA domain-containing protein 1 n=1 Tax=Episyrphus balteatus TaxID=286459 RepID=UPI002485C58E|nr:OCIA domain-containing protein 1 [Episyrphus balteatus]
MNTPQPGILDPGSPQRPQHPLANYHFSSDELRVLKECDVESFFQRSLPFGTGFGLSAYFGVKHGYLKPNVKFGALPKVMVGVIVGYFLGKFSYQQKCAEKIMRIPGSKLGEMLRQKKNNAMYGMLTPDKNLGAGIALSPFTPSNADIFSDESLRYGKSSSLELDTESRPTLSGLDDIYRPSVDDPSPQFETDLPVVAPKQGVTYDELRMKNREEYMKKSQSIYSRPLPAEAPTVRRSMGSNDNTEAQRPTGERNKYGDTWTN